MLLKKKLKWLEYGKSISFLDTLGSRKKNGITGRVGSPAGFISGPSSKYLRYETNCCFEKPGLSVLYGFDDASNADTENAAQILNRISYCLN